MEGKVPTRPVFLPMFKEVRPSRYPMVFGIVPDRLFPSMLKLDTRVANPIVPHVTPVQAEAPVTQGSYGADPGHQFVSAELPAVRAL